MDSEEIVAHSLSELEKSALERRQRLKELRTQFVNRRENENGEKSTDGMEREEMTALLFRSYKPASNTAAGPFAGRTKEEISALEQNITDQLMASEDTKIEDELDLKTLAPRKVDWDLRRGVQDKLDKLERRTKKAINKIIRKRMQDEEETSGQQQLAEVVGSIGEK